MAYWTIILGYFVGCLLVVPLAGVWLKRRRLYYPRYARSHADPPSCRCGFPREQCKAGDC